MRLARLTRVHAADAPSICLFDERGMATFQQEVEDMSVKQLKAVIEEQGLSHIDCTEKSELRDRAREAIAKGASNSSAAAAAPPKADEAQRIMDVLSQINEAALQEVLTPDQRAAMEARVLSIASGSASLEQGAQLSAQVGLETMAAFDGSQKEAFLAIAHRRATSAAAAGSIPTPLVDVFMAQTSKQLGVSY